MVKKKIQDVVTKQQETFIQGLIDGLSQRNALLKAYPDKENWKGNSLDSFASTMLRKEKIKKRYEEALLYQRKVIEEKAGWTREESVRTLRQVIDTNRADIERINKASEDELQFLLDQIEKDPKHTALYVKQMLVQRKQRRISGVHNGGIVSAVSELNKMQGFNEETINLGGAVVFTGVGELED